MLARRCCAACRPWTNPSSGPQERVRSSSAATTALETLGRSQERKIVALTRENQRLSERYFTGVESLSCAGGPCNHAPAAGGRIGVVASRRCGPGLSYSLAGKQGRNVKGGVLP